MSPKRVTWSFGVTSVSRVIDLGSATPFHTVMLASTQRKLRRFFRLLYRTVFVASRQGRPYEIAVWSNAVASLLVAGATFYAVRAAVPTILSAVLLFVALRLALISRHTVWIAATLGTLAVGGGAGGLAWLFGHVIETAGAASIAGVLGAMMGALGPAWAYSELVRRRSESVRDSLMDPVSMPSSGA